MTGDQIGRQAAGHPSRAGAQYQRALEVARDSTFCAVVHSARRLTAEAAPELHEAGASVELFLLLAQVYQEPDCSPAELARACGFSAQHLAGLLDRAEGWGLIARIGRRGRGLRTRIRIEPAGVDLLAVTWPRVQQVGADRLSSRQHQQLRSLLRRLHGQAVLQDDDLVVLSDEDGHDTGTAHRLEVHGNATPRHRAFSTYLRDETGRVLITRRALHKATWPGVWTNAACGHLRPGESHEQAALRRVPEELGTAPRGLSTVLPDFRYRAVDASGLVENELCPVMTGWVDAGAVDPDPEEVAEHAWVEWADLRRTAEQMPVLLSPWSVLQIRGLAELEDDGHQLWGRP